MPYTPAVEGSSHCPTEPKQHLSPQQNRASPENNDSKPVKTTNYVKQLETHIKSMSEVIRELGTPGLPPKLSRTCPAQVCTVPKPSKLPTELLLRKWGLCFQTKSFKMTCPKTLKQNTFSTDCLLICSIKSEFA